MLTSIETTQILQIVENLDKKNKKVPFYTDLEQHSVFGQFFIDLDKDQKKEIPEIINGYIIGKIQDGKTKGSEFFRRFYNLNKEDFWLFRELNEDSTNVDSKDFQDIGKIIKEELFKYENMLTQNMTKRGYGLDKVVGAFYDLVHSFFPWFSFVK